MSTRRRFLRDGACLALGASGLVAWQRFPWHGAEAIAEDKPAGAEARAAELKLEIPKPASTNAVILSAVRSGNLLFVSGHIAKDAAGKPLVGKVGKDMDKDQAALAARNVALQILGVVRQELGSLDRVVRVVKVLGMVNCTPEFTETPQVINGFSQVLIDVYGEKNGKGARSAVGMGSLPLGVAVEVEAIFEVRDGN
jgi:enamine deaminase RidA (YjgF/YER057c/UK114 family)